MLYRERLHRCFSNFFRPADTVRDLRPGATPPHSREVAIKHGIGKQPLLTEVRPSARRVSKPRCDVLMLSVQLKLGDKDRDTRLNRFRELNDLRLDGRICAGVDQGEVR